VHFEVERADHGLVLDVLGQLGGEGRGVLAEKVV
jgi:hypothetical protein